MPRSVPDGRTATPTGTILHIGAGLCTQLTAHLQADPAAIVLVEPDPDRLAELEADTAGHDVVQVIPAAIARKAGTAILRRFNQPDLNSLSQPTGAKRLYPGLRQTGQASVETLTPKRLLERIAVDPDLENWLIVEAPGQEAFILRDLQARKALNQFRNIILHCGTEPMFRSGLPAARLMQDLAQAGYTLRADLDSSDPDWRHWHLRLDPTEQHQHAPTERAGRLKAERDALKQTRAELEQAKAEIEDLTGKADAAERDLKIALRLQAVAAADLSELRARYSALLDSKQNQDRLLQTLTQRLSEASDYLHALSLDRAAAPQAVPNDARQTGPDAGDAPLRHGRTKPK